MRNALAGGMGVRSRENVLSVRRQCAEFGGGG